MARIQAELDIPGSGFHSFKTVVGGLENYVYFYLLFCMGPWEADNYWVS
jgi:hypothetical protein